MLSSWFANGLKCSNSLQFCSSSARLAASRGKLARTKLQFHQFQCRNAASTASASASRVRLSTTSHTTPSHLTTISTRGSSLSDLFRNETRNFSTVLSRWYRSKNDAIAARAQRASRESSGSGSGWRAPRFRVDPPWKRWFERLPSEVVVYGILAINGAVYVAWLYASDRLRNGYPQLYVQLHKNVLLSWQNIREGRIWTIITSTFSHSEASHILMNALTFYFMAPPVIRLLGNTSFLMLYFMGGIACSTLSLMLNKSVRNREGASNGASGAIFAVMTVFACVAPRTPFYLFFVVPVPAWAVVGGLFIWDGLSTITDRKTRVDGAGHVGGILAGLAYFVLKMRGL